MRWGSPCLRKLPGFFAVGVFILTRIAFGQEDRDRIDIVPAKLVYFNTTDAAVRKLESSETASGNSPPQARTEGSFPLERDLYAIRHYSKGRVRFKKAKFVREKSGRRQGQQCAGVCRYIPDRDFCSTLVIPPAKEEYEAFEDEDYYSEETSSEASSEEYLYSDEYKDDDDYEDFNRVSAGKKGNKKIRLTKGRLESKTSRSKRKPAAQKNVNSSKNLHVVFPPLTRYAVSRGSGQGFTNGTRERNASKKKIETRMSGLKGGRRRKQPFAPEVKLRPQALEQEIIIRWDHVVERGPYIGGDIVEPEGVLLRPPNFRFLRKQWPNGVIPFTMDPSLNSCRQDAIFDAMDEIEEKTCIRFVDREGDRNYIAIQRAQVGCSSYVGMIGGAQHLNLSTGCFSKFTVTHELMHAIGFDHEQSRKDRDKYIDIDFENVINAKEGQFELNPSFTGNGFPYDLRSIMHYSAFLFGVNKCEPTIYPIDDKIDICELGIGNGKGGMTNCDAAKINKMYKCSGRKYAKSCKVKG